jgi:anthranilate/para-aminobenzoate synthase component I
VVTGLDGVSEDELIRSLAARPGLVVLHGDWAGGSTVVAADPIRSWTDSSQPGPPPGPPGAAGDDDVLGGGWFGTLSYPDARPEAAGGPPGPSGEPERGPRQRQWLGFYPSLLRYRRTDRRWYDEAITDGTPGGWLERRRRDFVADVVAGRERARQRPGAGYRLGAMTAQTTRESYCAAVVRCIEHIRDGDVYQANLCLNLAGSFAGDPVALFADLSRRLTPAYGALVCTGEAVVVSVSPELFLRRIGREVESAPIKGTRPAGPAGPGRLGSGGPDDPGRDPNAVQLAESAKERAENVMIVDLVRNDLSRVAEPGTVDVPSLLRVERHVGVWHLVSRVTARLAGAVTDADLISATFPPASITGAPKIRAQQIISALEPAERGVYTGSVGYFSTARTELSVAIRTMTIVGPRATLGVGAGITASSDPGAEWSECLLKARPLLIAASSSMTATGQESSRSAGAGVGLGEGAVEVGEDTGVGDGADVGASAGSPKTR